MSKRRLLDFVRTKTFLQTKTDQGLLSGTFIDKHYRNVMLDAPAACALPLTGIAEWRG